MFRLLGSVLKFFANACWWSALFLVCRFAVWWMGWPAWWTLPLGVALGLAWLFSGLARTNLRNGRSEHGADGAESVQQTNARAAWRDGAALRRRARARLFGLAPALPWYILLESGDDQERVLDACDAGSECGDENEMIWRLCENALWLEPCFAFNREDGGRWSILTRLLAEQRMREPLGGVVAVLDAAILLDGKEKLLREKARLLRRRLESLREELRENIPAYLLINRLDKLYGLRSHAAFLDARTLDIPLGAICNSPITSAASLSQQSLAKVSAFFGATAAYASASPASQAAMLQAPAELNRLEKPLARFCAQVFHDGGTGRSPFLRGIYFCSTSATGRPLSPLPAKLASFRPAVEPASATDPWFLSDLLRFGIPRDAKPARRAAERVTRRPLLRGGIAGMLGGTLLLCWMLTCSFLESRHVLLSAAGRSAPPETREELAPYFELAELTRLRNNGWRLPRFGMTQAENLEEELRRRYTDSYFDLKAIPDLDSIQDDALAAARSDDPVEIGNTLLRLVVLRKGLDGRGMGGKNSDPLRSVAESLRLTSSEEMRQLDTYLDWAGEQEWMPAVRDALLEFEKHLVDNAGGGRLEWLPAWIDSLPHLQAHDVSRVWEPLPVPPDLAEELRIAPAWTLGGYRHAEMLLAVAAHDGGDSERLETSTAVLAQYRQQAVDKWRGVAEGIWSGFRDRIGDRDLRLLLRNAGRRQDPASRFADLLRKNLLPMWAGEEADPDIAWLRLYDALPLAASAATDSAGMGGLEGLARRMEGAIRSLGSDDGVALMARDMGFTSSDRRMDSVEDWRTLSLALRQAALLAETPAANLEAVRAHFRAGAGSAAPFPSDGPYAEAGALAANLHRYLREESGSAAWDAVSPLASYDYFRYLAVRQAALVLDRLWLEEVYNPCLFIPGSGADKTLRLVGENGELKRFLNDRAAGLWRWHDGRIVNAVWDGLDFMLDEPFLQLCSSAALHGFAPPPEAVFLPLRVYQVSVNPDADEFPEYAEFFLAMGDETQTLTFRNYPASRVFEWRPATAARAGVRVVFPSLKAEIPFDDETGLSDFVSMFADGGCVLGPEMFGENAAALRRLGVEKISLRAEMKNADEFHRHNNAVVPPPPQSIVVPDRDETVRPHRRMTGFTAGLL